MKSSRRAAAIKANLNIAGSNNDENRSTANLGSKGYSMKATRGSSRSIQDNSEDDKRSVSGRRAISNRELRNLRDSRDKDVESPSSTSSSEGEDGTGSDSDQGTSEGSEKDGAEKNDDDDDERSSKRTSVRPPIYIAIPFVRVQRPSKEGW